MTSQPSADIRAAGAMVHGARSQNDEMGAAAASHRSVADRMDQPLGPSKTQWLLTLASHAGALRLAMRCGTDDPVIGLESLL